VNMIAELDVEVTVSVERVVADQSTMGDLGKTVVLELAYTNVRMANNGTDVVVELADTLVDGDIVTVSVSGYGVAEDFTFSVPQA
ncbi:MAG: hypothetical protein IJ452_02325, partial [Butyricicoccus sp.]|nr:hypothetical protein [Butyricicoccus sp.]